MRAPPLSLRPMTGAPFVHREVHDLADLAGVRPRQRAAEHGEVLREHVDERPSTRPWPVTRRRPRTFCFGHPEVGAAVGDEAVELDERARVEQRVDPLPGGELVVAVLARDAIRATAELGCCSSARSFSLIDDIAATS
jgi:hypothetical protein